MKTNKSPSFVGQQRCTSNDDSCIYCSYVYFTLWRVIQMRNLDGILEAKVSSEDMLSFCVMQSLINTNLRFGNMNCSL